MARGGSAFLRKVPSTEEKLPEVFRLDVHQGTGDLKTELAIGILQGKEQVRPGTAACASGPICPRTGCMAAQGQPAPSHQRGQQRYGVAGRPANTAKGLDGRFLMVAGLFDQLDQSGDAGKRRSSPASSAAAVSWGCRAWR